MLCRVLTAEVCSIPQFREMKCDKVKLAWHSLFVAGQFAKKNKHFNICVLQPARYPNPKNFRLRSTNKPPTEFYLQKNHFLLTNKQYKRLLTITNFSSWPATFQQERAKRKPNNFFLNIRLILSRISQILQNVLQLLQCQATENLGFHHWKHFNASRMHFHTAMAFMVGTNS